MLQIIVVNYRTPSDLRDFLDSVSEATAGVEYDLYIANVQPEDEDLKVIVDRALRSNDHHIVLDENVGYARAVNHCASRSNASHIGIFNADVILSPDLFSAAITALEENLTWGMLSPRQMDRVGRITHAGIFGTNDHPAHRGWQALDSPAYHDVRDDAVTLSGSALVVKRTCWDEMFNCPIFQETFPGAQGAFGVTPHYYEETLFAYHLRHHDWKAVYYGPLKVIHKWHTASAVGGWAEQQMPVSQAIFRNFCQRHDIVCD